MAYARLITELFRRSGLQINEYAEAIGISTTHLSTILNGHQDGSRKILEACLANTGMNLGDLQLPEPDAETQEEKDVLRLYRRLSDERRKLACSILKQFAAAERAHERKRLHKRHEDTQS